MPLLRIPKFSVPTRNAPAAGSYAVPVALPTQLGLLGGTLATLQMDNAALSGTMPPELGALRRLARLDASRNSLSGTLPSELVGSSSLVFLELQINKISGTVLSEIGSLTSLATLSLACNALTPPLPDALEEVLKRTEACRLGFNPKIADDDELPLWLLDSDCKADRRGRC